MRDTALSHCHSAILFLCRVDGIKHKAVGAKVHRFNVQKSEDRSPYFFSINLLMFGSNSDFNSLIYSADVLLTNWRRYCAKSAFKINAE